MCKTIRYACGHAEKSPCQRGLVASSSRPRAPSKKRFWDKLFNSPSTSSDRSCRAIDINKHHFCPDCEAAEDRLALNPRLSGPFHPNLHDEVWHLPDAGRSGVRQRDSRPLSPDTAARLNALPGFYDLGDQSTPAPAPSRTRSRNERAPTHPQGTSRLRSSSQPSAPAPYPGSISESRARHPHAPAPRPERTSTSRSRSRHPPAPPPQPGPIAGSRARHPHAPSRQPSRSREQNISHRPVSTDYGPSKDERYNLILGRWEGVEPRGKPLPPAPATPPQQSRDRHRNADPAEVLQERYEMGTGLWESHDDSPLHHHRPRRPQVNLLRNHPQMHEVPRGRGQVYRAVGPMQPQEAVRGGRSPVLPPPRRGTSPAAPMRRHEHSNHARNPPQLVQRPEVQQHRSNTLPNRHNLPHMSSSIGKHIDDVEQMWRKAGKERK